MFEIALIIAVVTAFTELVKRLDLVPVKYLPTVSIALGIAGGILYLPGSLKEQVMYGLMMGLAASGLFDQSKIITKK